MSATDRDNLLSLLDLPPEIIYVVFSNFPVKTLLVIAQVSRAFQAIALECLERRLHTVLSHEQKDLFLRLGWYTPMKPIKRPITWEYAEAVSLTDGNTFKAGSDRKPSLPKVDSQFLIFKPGDTLSDPWFQPGRIWWGGEDELECYHPNIPGYHQADDEILSELVTVDWFEDFVQFKLRLYLAGLGERQLRPYEIENNMIRIPRAWLDQWSEKGPHADNPNEHRPTEHLIWFDDQKTIGLQLSVSRNPDWAPTQSPGDDIYDVSLHSVWLNTFRFLLEDEFAEQHFTKDNQQITILVVG